MAANAVIRHRQNSRGRVIFAILKGLYSPAAYASAQVVEPVGKQKEKPEATVMQMIIPRGSIPPATAMAATRGVSTDFTPELERKVVIIAVNRQTIRRIMKLLLVQLIRLSSMLPIISAAPELVRAAAVSYTHLF